MANQPGTWVFQDGPITFQCASAVPKGVLVMRDSTTPSQIKVATAGATTVLGVAMKAGAPAGDATAHTATNRAGVGTSVPVALSGVVRVTFASAVQPGDPLVAAASGQVTKYTSGGTSTYDQIVGTAMEVVSSGAVGAMEIE